MSKQIKGTKAFIRALDAKGQTSDVIRVVAENAAALEANMKSRANFTQGYQTGATKNSITTEISDGGLTAAVLPKTEYAPFLINGTRHMAAQDFMRPALYSQRAGFLSDLLKTIEKDK